MKKIYIASLVVVLAIIGGYFFPRQKTVLTVGASPSGSSYIGAGVFNGVVVNLSAPGVNATSSSIVNNTGNDLYITGEAASCEGVGTSLTAYTGTALASLTVSIATSTTVAPVTNSNTNTIATLTIATSTPNFVLASTSSSGMSSQNVIWLAGSPLTFTVNATNTAKCTLGVYVIGS